MTIPEQAVQAAINAWFEETRPHVMNTTPLPEQARRMRLALTAAIPFMMDAPCGYRLIPQQPTQTVLEIMAFNLSAEFGADFTRENQEFALAVYNEAWTHGIRPLDQSTAAAPHLAAVRVNVDALAQEIRRVDGNHDKGAAALAEALIPFLSALEPSAGRAAVLEEALRKMVALYESEYDADVPFKRPDWLVSALHPVADKPDEAGAQGEGWPTGEYEVDYEVISNGEWVAGSTDLADAKHYAAVYGPDGPVEIVEARTYRRTLPTPPGGEVA